jgi:hypothetical protein
MAAPYEEETNEVKPDTIALEHVDPEKDEPSPVVDYTPEELKRVIRKLDWHLQPLCFVLYTFSVLDVSSGCPQRAICGMQTDCVTAVKHWQC